MRALSCVVILLACRREPPRADPEPVATPTIPTPDAEVEVDPLAELSDAAGVFYPYEATISSVVVEPRTALSDAKDTLARNRWRFRRCGAAVTGSTDASLRMRVGEGGDVASSTSQGPIELTKCLGEAARNVKFSQPVGGAALVEVDLKYAPR